MTLVKTGSKTFQTGSGVCVPSQRDYPIHNPRPTTKRGERRKPGKRPSNFEYGN